MIEMDLDLKHVKIPLAEFERLVKAKTERELVIRALAMEVPRDMVLDTFMSVSEKEYYEWP